MKVDNKVITKKIKTVFGNNTAILVEDKKNGGYTGWIKEEKSIISEGDTIDECIENLQNAAIDIKNYKESI